MNLKWYFFVESGCLKFYLEKYENIFGFFVFVEVFVEKWINIVCFSCFGR